MCLWGGRGSKWQVLIILNGTTVSARGVTRVCVTNFILSFFIYLFIGINKLQQKKIRFFGFKNIKGICFFLYIMYV